MFESWKEQIKEIITVIITTLTNSWFWLPVLFSAGVYIDLWVMINIHPLAGAVLPVALITYAIRTEEKRIKLRYDIKDKRYIKPLHGFGQFPEPDRRKELIEELAASKKRSEQEKSE
jgi:hypothetical protein